MKIVILVILTGVMLLSLFGCQMNPRDTDETEPVELTEVSDNVIVTTEIVITETQFTSITEFGLWEEIEESPFYIFEDGTIEIRMVKLVNAFAMHVMKPLIMPMDDRYIVISHYNGSNYSYSLLDTQELCIVYTDPLEGVSYNTDFKTDETGKIYVYSLTSGYNGDGYDIYDYYNFAYKTYFYTDRAVTEECEFDFYRIEMSGRILREIDGGIFEDKGGELIELLPPVPEDLREYYIHPTRGELMWNRLPNAVNYTFIKKIDESRFLYTFESLEKTAPMGLGIYDFTTGQSIDIPNTFGFHYIDIDNFFIYSSNHSGGYITEVYTTSIDTFEINCVIKADNYSKSGYLTTVAMSPNKQYLALSDEDRKLYIVNISNGAVEKTYNLKDYSLQGPAIVQFLGNNKLLLLSGENYNTHIRLNIIPFTP
ncbi:MAG: hypothetical protein FWD34_08925 [Oscillospiraceae bacterium]|nr:hypothetical protein [Oscillospiraceae bacterium]